MADRPLVRLRVSSDYLLRHLLHLPDAVLEAASVEGFRGGGAPDVISLYVRYPGAPEGADEMSPVFHRHDSGETELAEVQWYADGRRLAPEPSPA